MASFCMESSQLDDVSVPIQLTPSKTHTLFVTIANNTSLHYAVGFPTMSCATDLHMDSGQRLSHWLRIQRDAADASPPLRSGDGILSIEPDNLQQNASVRRTHSTAAQASPSYTKLQARALKQIYSASERFLIADVDSGAAENLA
ncbi:hypothetical protein T4B_5020 [Trichinella pseudospiralis]|uniref:Uncharacterized protein n=1 Tax=Trichinella pseudospiralis TaxID=6337 RepID=A0A0V1HI43_TRIPS|nr:hypothetical protein T4B_5020 [Trichinella pseudospiralis]